MNNYKRLLLVDEKTGEYVKVDKTFIDWNKSGVVETPYGWRSRFITEHGAVYRSDNVFCENEWTAQDIFNRTRRKLDEPNTFGCLYMFCICPKSKDGTEQVSYYFDGHTRSTIFKADDFYKTMKAR